MNPAEVMAQRTGSACNAFVVYIRGVCYPILWNCYIYSEHPMEMLIPRAPAQPLPHQRKQQPATRHARTGGSATSSPSRRSCRASAAWSFRAPTARSAARVRITSSTSFPFLRRVPLAARHHIFILICRHQRPLQRKFRQDHKGYCWQC